MPFVTRPQRLKRLRSRLSELRQWIDRAYVDVGGWEFGGSPLALGERWPANVGVQLLRCAGVRIPAEWQLADCRLDLDLGGEGLLRILYSDGREESWGHDPNHRRFPLRGPSFDLEAEVVARFPFGQPNRDARLARARLILVDSAVERSVRQIYLVAEAVGVLESHEVAEPLLAAAERALDAICWPSATGEYVARTAGTPDLQHIWSLPPGLDSHPPGLSAEERATVAAAGALLEADLLALAARYPPVGAVAVTGHAHLDLAWLWPMDETRRKARRTFSTITGLMERYPELRFNQSSAQLYAFVEHDDPALFARIQERVRSGQWEPVGGMWVEPDINMPAGESLARQLLYGQRYFERTFGTTHRVCWLPDCFGFSPALPQLLRLAGIDSFFTIKLTWSETNIFPYDLFWWEGLDGSRVLAHMFDNPGHSESDTGGYNADTGPFTSVSTWRNFRGKHTHPETLLSIGYGDGGGGVTAEMLEQARELQTFPTLPSLRFTSVEAFYNRLHRSVAAHEIPVWLGEMYLELHRGTLTSQGRVKRLHRRAEHDLVAAEFVGAMNHLLGGSEPKSLEPLWHLLLRNEFHDILPGSSIREVYATAERELASVVEQTGRIMDDGLNAIAGRAVPVGPTAALLLVNPDLTDRPMRLETPAEIPGGQPVEGGYVATAPGTVPGLGFAVVTNLLPAGPVEVSERTLENEMLRVTLRDDGTLGSVLDKESGREVLSDRGNQLWAYVDKPANWDAWDVDAGYERNGAEIDGVEAIDIVERGPHRTAIRVRRRFRNSTIVQDIRLWAASPRLEFKTTLDWHDRRWLLKARFPLAVRSSRASFETAFGVVDRATHRNTSWESARFEVAAHRFADLSEPGFGVALLNDGKYGHHAIGSELGISLLRSPHYPDPLADEGVQTFVYALLPHGGAWPDGRVLMEAEDLNRPLLARTISATGSSARRVIDLTGLPLALGSLKAGEEGGLVLRAYEPYGARGQVAVSLPSGWEMAGDLDLLERPLGDAMLSFSPFQVRTWLLRRTD